MENCEIKDGSENWMNFSFLNFEAIVACSFLMLIVCTQSKNIVPLDAMSYARLSLVAVAV